MKTFFLLWSSWVFFFLKLQSLNYSNYFLLTFLLVYFLHLFRCKMINKSLIIGQPRPVTEPRVYFRLQKILRPWKLGWAGGGECIFLRVKQKEKLRCQSKTLNCHIDHCKDLLFAVIALSRLFHLKVCNQGLAIPFNDLKTCDLTF